MWKILFALLVGLGVVVIYNPVAVASPEPVRFLAQQGDVTFEKIASVERVNLGEVFSYTITITNNGSSTIEPRLTDNVPEQLILSSETIITATAGTTSVEGKSISWTGNVKGGDQVHIIYDVIVPSLGKVDESISSVAVMKFNGRTLETEAVVITQEGYHGVIWWFLSPFVKAITWALIFVDLLLEQANIPYAFGFSIILFTVGIRIMTYPLTVQQVKSSKAMQELQPQLKALQDKYKDKKEELAMAQMELYRKAGVNPFGGCLPMVIQMPVWISLYWALVQLSREGALTAGFFWIPSLGGPVAYQHGSIGWLWPLPPSIGWEPALSYLVLPVLLIVSQLYMQQMMSPPATDPQQQQMQQMMKFMPLMFGYFALIVPAGLTLYWFTNNLLMVAQQHFTKTHLNVNLTSNGPEKYVVIESVVTNDSSFSNDNSKEGKKRKNVRKHKRNR
jgi:YidC/Oxa1 family membrane protein insertase